MGKKKMREFEAVGQNDLSSGSGTSQSSEKQRKKKKKTKEHQKDVESAAIEMPTVSIAVPGSIIDNAQSLELATRLAGQVARAATIFRIDEIIVVDNKSISEDTSTEMVLNNSVDNESGAAFLLRILTYLETPQYLRKDLFPKHNSLRFVGLLSPLDAPHHLRKHEWCSYREGITRKNLDGGSAGTLVDVGLSKDNCGVPSYEDLMLDFEDAVLKQQSSCVRGSRLIQLKERRLQSQIQHRLTELEDLPTNRGEDLQSRCLLELYGLKLAELENKVRSEVISEYWLRLRCANPDKQLFDWGMMQLRRPLYVIGDAFAVETDDPLKKKRDSERLSRFLRKKKGIV